MACSEAKSLFVAPVLVLFLALKCPAAESASADRASPSAQQQMETWWADLAKQEPDASRALLNLAARPNAAVPFLKTKLRPLKIDAVAVKALLKKLGSDDEAVWKPAFEELEYLDPRLAINLETLMADVTEAPARQRLVEVLSGYSAGFLKDAKIALQGLRGEGFNFFQDTSSGNRSWWAEHQVGRLGTGFDANVKRKWIRAVRATILLAHIGTPDALAIVKEMAGGHPDALPTKVAKEALAAHKASAPLK